MLVYIDINPLTNMITGSFFHRYPLKQIEFPRYVVGASPHPRPQKRNPTIVGFFVYRIFH